MEESIGFSSLKYNPLHDYFLRSRFYLHISGSVELKAETTKWLENWIPNEAAFHLDSSDNALGPNLTPNHHNQNSSCPVFCTELICAVRCAG